MKASFFFVLLFLVLFVGTRSHALDCLDLRILPLYKSNEMTIEGLISEGKATSGTGRRQRFLSFLSSAAASETVDIVINGASHSVKLDENGAFSTTIRPLAASGQAEVHDPDTRQTIYQRQFAFPSSPGFLLISDIDDTILVSDVSHKMRLVLKTIFRSVKGRKPVPGAPALYQELTGPRNLHGSPLVFYLSASPSTLARFLEAFVRENGFPEGVFCLKRSITAEGIKPGDHKKKWLNRIADLYPGVPMLVLGDSGELDPEIYAEFFETGKAKSLGVIIRRLDDSGQIERWNPISLRLNKLRIPFFLWKDSSDLSQPLVKEGILNGGE